MIDVAIVGIGCRFPGNVRSADEFWDFLKAKGDGICEVPADRWSLDRFYDPDPDAPGRMYVRQGGFLSQSLYDFDPDYFGISHREASIMDPQQRLVLEVAVEALDDAGMGSRVGGRDVGVYVGGFTNDNMVVRHTRESRSAINSHTATSGTFTMLSNRLSYVLDMTGPSMTIDTACSSSLVAVHEAAQAVARGECEAAIAGGVNAMLRPETFVAMCKGRFLAPDGRCKTFDAAADGYARGEGSGMVVLKPLAAARADGDRVYAVIRASGANQDGRTSGITVPNPVSQAALARRVLAESGLQARDIGYIEAHGTGTSIGDPLELQALGTTYGDVEGRHTPLVVGSVKASIGHLEAAAGVVSVIKAALTVHHGEITPQGWLNELNPAIPFDDYRVEIPTELRAFPDGYARRAVAVNGFGYGGTNAHVVLSADDAADPLTPTSYDSDLATTLLPLSGRNEGAVRDLAAALATQVRDPGVDEPALPHLIEAAWNRRLHHPVRTTVAADDVDTLLAELDRVADSEGRAPSRTVTTDAPVFVFSGMGPQWWRMGRDLLIRDGAFATRAREIDARFVELTGTSIITELLRDEDDSKVSRTEVAQPANFLVQVALVAELEALGVHPTAVVGHSVGEVSAAYVSGALSLDDALLVSHHRSRLQATTAGTGGMLAVGLPEADVLAWLPDDGTVSVAAVNSPSSVTLAGELPVLEPLAARLTEEGIFARALRVEVPYHSHLMDPILDDVRESLASLTPQAPVVPLYSSVTAGPVTDATWGPDYWVDNVREPVRFADTVAVLVADGHRVFVEIGPHPVLGGNIREILVRGGETGTVVSTLHRDTDDATSVRQALADLYVAGALTADRVPGARPGPVAQLALPAYPWQRTRVWSEVDSMTEDRLGVPTRPLLAERTSAAQPEWITELSATALPWIPDHVVDGLTVLPGAAYLDMALSAARELGRHDSYALADLRITAPLVIDAHDVPVLRLSAEPRNGRFGIDSRTGEPGSVWGGHVTGRIVAGSHVAGAHRFEPEEQATHVLGESLYAQLDERGLSYGPAFRRIVEAWAGPTSLVARVDASGLADSGHTAHPAPVDAALQCVAALVALGPDAPEGPMVPVAVDAVRWYAGLPDELTVAVRRHDRSGLFADIALAGPDGTVVLELLGVEFLPVRPAGSLLSQLEPLWYATTWEREGTPRQGSPDDLVGRLLVVLESDDTDAVPAAARALLDAHPRAELVRLPGGSGDLLRPTGADVVTHAVDSALTADPEGLREPITVVLVASTAERTLGPDSGSVSALLSTASAVQGVLDAQVLAGSTGADDQSDEETGGPVVRGVLITEQAVSLPGDHAPVRLGHSIAMGARRTLRNEQPQLEWRVVDIESATAPAELVGEVLGGSSPNTVADNADEVALRGGLRFAMRVASDLAERVAERDTATILSDPERNFTVETPTSMLMSDLALRAVERVTPGPDQVEVQVLSAGLNYKDAGKVIGLLTEKELAGTFFGTEVGMEVIARVVRVGPEVRDWAVGDRVSLVCRNPLQRFVTVDLHGHELMMTAPTPWADTDSALNLPFLTAHYALDSVARLTAGETVLVQGAAGGVGLAAIQVAKQLGAIVIGTASTQERRDAVLAAGADVALDSRSLSFVDDVRRLTGGEGVEVVLSSAPGEVVAANLEVAAEFGRIVDIGKADIYGGGLLALAEFDRNLSFHAVDLDRLFAKRRDVVVELVATVFAMFESGAYVPLPTNVYPVSQVADAFEAVIRSNQLGRVVLDFTEPEPPVRPLVPRVRFRNDASYLVTGGFGDFGLVTARWLADVGVRHLVLAGRSGATSVAAKDLVADLTAAGVEVQEAVLDVSSPAAVADLVASIQAGPAPLRGVFHAAGVLDDGPFTDVDAASVARVLGPKVVGAWNLHRATVDAGVELDHFVLYSSASGITGNVPQVTYAGANTALDSLVQLRRDEDLPGLSINWGAMSGGMADSSVEVAKYLAAIGLQTIDMDLGARLMAEIIPLGVRQVGVIDMDWSRWGATHPASASAPRFAEHIAAAASDGSGVAALAAALADLAENQQNEVVAFMLAEQLAVVLGVPAESVDLDTALPDLGMDSLMAVELQARVNLALGIEVSALEFSRGGGLSALATRLLPKLTGVGQAV